MSIWASQRELSHRQTGRNTRTTSLWLYPTFLSILTQLSIIKIFVSMEEKLVKNEGASYAKEIYLEGKLNLLKVTM